MRVSRVRRAGNARAVLPQDLACTGKPQPRTAHFPDRDVWPAHLPVGWQSGAPSRAAQLYLSDPTIKSHVARILAKLDLRDRVQTVVYAYETGIIRPGSNP
jgi:hypothetical protein